jgi:hypothetical protein
VSNRNVFYAASDELYGLEKQIEKFYGFAGQNFMLLSGYRTVTKQGKVLNRGK